MTEPHSGKVGLDRLPSDKLGLLLRVGSFIVLAWTTLLFSPYVMVWLAGSRELYFVVGALSSFAAGAVANAVIVRIFEHGRLSDFGLGWTSGWSSSYAPSPYEAQSGGSSDSASSPSGSSAREVLIGAALGIGAVLLIVAVPLIAGDAVFTAAPAVERRWASLLLVSLVLLFGAAGEEMMFHGYAFQLLVRSLGPFATILPVGVLFGLAHLGNPNATFLGILNTIGWGVLLGYAYVRTGALWLSIGMHFGWNLALALSGANLSGFTMGLTGYALRWRAGDLWSGGGYGPEGSLLTTAIVVSLFFVVVRVTPEWDVLSEV